MASVKYYYNGNGFETKKDCICAAVGICLSPAEVLPIKLYKLAEFNHFGYLQNPEELIEMHRNTRVYIYRRKDGSEVQSTGIPKIIDLIIEDCGYQNQLKRISAYNYLMRQMKNNKQYPIVVNDYIDKFKESVENRRPERIFLLNSAKFSTAKEAFLEFEKSHGLRFRKYSRKYAAVLDENETKKGPYKVEYNIADLIPPKPVKHDTTYVAYKNKPKEIVFQQLLEDIKKWYSIHEIDPRQNVKLSDPPTEEELFEKRLGAKIQNLRKAKKKYDLLQSGEKDKDELMKKVGSSTLEDWQVEALEELGIFESKNNAGRPWYK